MQAWLDYPIVVLSCVHFGEKAIPVCSTMMMG